MSELEKKAIEWFREDLTKEKEKMEYYNEYKKQVIKRNEKLLNLIEKQQKEIEEKTTILLAGAEKVKQLEKEIEDLQTKLEIEKIDNKYNQEERDEETIPRYKIKEIIENAEADIDYLTHDLIEDLEKLLGEN